MPPEISRAAFGEPSYHRDIHSFPDAKLKMGPYGWLIDKKGKRHALVGLYNGSVKPAAEVIMPENKWRSLQEKLLPRPKNEEEAKIPVDARPVPLPEWAVLRTSEEHFRANEGGFPSTGSILLEVDFSFSGGLQEAFEFSKPTSLLEQIK